MVALYRRARATTFDAVLRGARFRDVNVFTWKHLSYRRQSMAVYQQVPGLGIWTACLLNDLHSDSLHRFIEVSTQYNFRNHASLVLKKDKKKCMAWKSRT